MSHFDEMLNQYNFDYPEELIAQEPANPRDNARLLIYNRKKDAVSFSTFKDITEVLPKNSLIIFNETKVIPARLYAKKDTGGMIEIFYLQEENGYIKTMVNGKVTKGQKIFLSEEVYFTVVDIYENYCLMQPSNSIQSMYQILEEFGNTPIPPYIKHSSLSEEDLQKEYQTVFAKNKGSVAAPTAALHFTKELLEKIKTAGHDIAFVTLHVGLGTFAPLTEKNIQEKKLHEEWYEISPQTAEMIQHAKKHNRPIIAVGTTVVRTIESAFQISNNKKLSGTTELFIQEGYQFKIINGLITNFHVPKSSLMMLVSAFVGREKLLSLYKAAIEQKFRLFSFGDGMLII